MALMRCGIPFVWMGCELSKGREKERIEKEFLSKGRDPGGKRVLLTGFRVPFPFVPLTAPLLGFC